MKINLCCEDAKPTNKNGQKDKCNCKYLNRNFPKELKFYNAFMKSLAKPYPKKK